MRAPKLVQLMKTNSSLMTEALVNRIRASGKCGDLLGRVPESEQKHYAAAIFEDLTEWLGSEMDSALEQPYIDLGMHRAEQGVPRFQMFWAVCIAREFLWEYVQQECLHEDPVEFWGGVMLLRSLNAFFDHVLYFALVGYEKGEKGEKDKAAALSFLARRRPA